MNLAAFISNIEVFLFSSNCGLIGRTPPVSKTFSQSGISKVN